MVEQLIETFAAVDSGGAIHTLEVWQETVPAADLKNRNAPLRGLSRVLTDRGQTVNQNPDGTFEIVSTGEILRRT